MKLTVTGDINSFYVQTLCMIFFPGEKFVENQEITEDTPIMEVNVQNDETGSHAFAKLTYKGKTAEAQKFVDFIPQVTKQRTAKIAAGNVVLAVGSEILGYRPSWGMLTGVRPSKVAMEMLLNGNSKAKVRKILNNDYFVIPKKAALATDIARREQKIMGNPDIKDCSIYVSIPFCPSRCSYCSFVSYTTPKLLSLIPAYLDKLCVDLTNVLDTVVELGLNLKTIYIGGGTPTILTEEQLEKLLSLIDSKINVSSLEEFTLEGGRPDTITEGKLAVAKKYGITRISVNPQSLNEQVIKSIGRSHSIEEFYKAFEIARNSGIKCINTDLIAGLPGDNFKYFSATFDKIIALEPENITVHTFCVKKAADILAQNQNIYSIRGGDVGKCVDYSQLRAQAAGYLPYYMYRQKNTVGNFENVGFALEGTEGLYNIYMMEEVHSILAVGAGAVTKLVEYYPANIASTKIIRHFNPKYPYEYLDNYSSADVIEEIKKFYACH